MSKNITIQEGGVAKQLTVDKLKTNLVGGGTQLWVPEDSVEQTTKNITANGTYKASDDGYYGYSEVTVNVPGGAGGPPGGRGSSIVGKDGDGDDAIVTVDPETGELEEEKLPNHIYVVTPPYNPRGIYADGETIDVGPDSGFEVVALLADNSLYEAPGYPMGHIPLSELTVEPTTAVYDESHDESGKYTGGGITAQRYISNAYPDQPSGDWYECIPGFYITIPSFSFLLTRYNNRVYAASVDGSAVKCSYSVRYEGGSTGGSLNCSADFSVTATTEHFGFVPESTSDPTGKTIIDLTPEPSGSQQTINVSWPRPGDGQVLETTFEIRVAPSPSGDDDN